MIKRGHIFTIPFKVKFIHLKPLPKCKHLGFYANSKGVVTAMISEYPFNSVIVTCIAICNIEGKHDFKQRRQYLYFGVCTYIIMHSRGRTI